MKKSHPNSLKALMKMQTRYLNATQMVIFVKADKRPWREMKTGERWVLDVERIEDAGHPQEEYLGHWRVTTNPRDDGRRPEFRVPVRYFYFISQERPPGEEEWKYDPEKAAQF